MAGGGGEGAWEGANHITLFSEKKWEGAWEGAFMNINRWVFFHFPSSRPANKFHKSYLKPCPKVLTAPRVKRSFSRRCSIDRVFF